MKIGIMMFQVVLFGLAICPALGAPQLRPTFNELARLDGKIVGGEATTIEAYPHQASVQLLGGHWCGGAIISASYVLSAAHCFDRYPVNWYDTRVGTTFHSTGGIETAIDTLTIHPNYNVLNLDNDLAILLLVTPLPLGNAISPIQMAFDNQQIAPGTNTVVSGWGALFQGGPSPAQLQAVSVPVVGNSDCAIAYAGYLVSDSMLCAGFPEGGRDACQGDSGGPLIANGVLVGLVSWGLGCAQPNYPGVYVSVPSVRAYIRQVTGV